MTTPAVAGSLEDDIRAAAEAAVSARTGCPHDNLAIKMHTLRIPHRYDGATSVTVTLPEYDDAIGPVTGRAEFRENGELLGSLPVPMRVTVFDDVFVTTAQVRRHTPITSALIVRQRVDVTRLTGRTVHEPDSVVGRWFTRTVGAGQIVDRKWIADVPLVRRGDHVTMAYGSTGVRVSAGVIAMEDGYRDQTISVKTEYANRLIQAIVVDASTVTPVR